MVWPLDLSDPEGALRFMITRPHFYDPVLVRRAVLRLTASIPDEELAAELQDKLAQAIAAMDKQARRHDQPMDRIRPFLRRTFAVLDEIVAAGEQSAMVADGNRASCSVSYGCGPRTL